MKGSTRGSGKLWLIAAGVVGAATIGTAQLLALDPDGVTTPGYSGAPTSASAGRWAGTAPSDGAGVDVATGELRYRTEVAFAHGVMLPFSFELSYSSGSLYDGRCGFGWFSALLDGRAVDHTTHASVLIDGVETVWTLSGGSYVNPAGILGTLTKTGSTFKLTKPDGSFVTYGPNAKSVGDRWGNTITVAHDVSGNPTQVTDSRGEVHTIELWPGTGRLKSLAMADGRSWTFRYDNDANLIDIQGPATVQFPTGIHWLFGYSTGSGNPALNHNMTSATDGRGNAWMTATYDGSDRVTVQSLGPDSLTFAYGVPSTNQTRVTDRAGDVREWEVDPATHARKSLLEKTNRNVRAGEGDYTTRWTADAAGYLTSVEFPSGSGIAWTLNAVKLPLERRHKAVLSDPNSGADLVESWEYDAAKYYGVTKYADPRGDIAVAGAYTEFTLNAAGQATGTSYPTVTNVVPNVTISTSSTYNADGTLASFTDGEGKVTTYTYYTSGPKKGRVQTVKQDDGGLDLTTTFDYNAWGLVTSLTDPRGNTTTRTIEAYGNVTQVSAPAPSGYVTNYTYDGNLNVTERRVKNIDENGDWATTPAWWLATYEYNVMNRLTTATEYVNATHNRVTTYTYNADDALASVTRDGKTVEYTYDERGLLYQRVRDPGTGSHVAATETFHYDGNRNVTSYVNGRGKATASTYDSYDRRIRSTNPLGHYREFAYDKCGNVTMASSYEDASPDVLRAQARWSYDEVNRGYMQEDLLIGTPDTWLSRVLTFDRRGLVTRATDRLLRNTYFTYDGAGRMTARTDAVGNVTTWTHDANGNVTAWDVTERIPGSSSTELYRAETSFDVLNRATSRSVIDRTNGANMKTTSWAYDSRNVVKSMTDPMGYATVYTYDGLGRCLSSTEPIASGVDTESQWAYDDNDCVTQFTDDNSRVTSFVYDGALRCTGNTYADLTSRSFAYDDNDNLVSWTDANGTTVTQTFDDADRLTSRTAVLGTGVVGDTSESFTYDALDRMTQALDNDSTVNYFYDSLSRVTAEQQGSNPIGSTGKTVGYTWNAEGDNSVLSYPGGFSATRAYDTLNRLESVTDGSNQVVSFALYGAGNRAMTASYGNTTHTAFTYDGFRARTSIDHRNSSGTSFAGFAYAWDKNDNPLYEARSHKSGHGDVYAYDRANRLKSVLVDSVNPAAEIATPGTIAYTTKRELAMDGVQNLQTVTTTPYGGSASSTTYTVNLVNQYTSVGGTALAYTSNGNLKDDGTNVYKYDFRNHLVEVRLKSTNALVASYAYDAVADGRRTHRTAGGTTTRYVYAAGKSIEEYNAGTGALLRNFVYADGANHAVSMGVGATRYYFHRQDAGSVTHVSNAAQAVAESYEYGEYGELTVRNSSGAVVPGTVVGNPFTFRGGRYDEATSLYLVGGRDYSPALRRYLQRAGTGLEEATNPYVSAPMQPLYVYSRRKRVPTLQMMGLTGLDADELTFAACVDKQNHALSGMVGGGGEPPLAMSVNKGSDVHSAMVAPGADLPMAMAASKCAAICAANVSPGSDVSVLGASKIDMKSTMLAESQILQAPEDVGISSVVLKDSRPAAAAMSPMVGESAGSLSRMKDAPGSGHPAMRGTVVASLARSGADVKSIGSVVGVPPSSDVFSARYGKENSIHAAVRYTVVESLEDRTRFMALLAGMVDRQQLLDLTPVDFDYLAQTYSRDPAGLAGEFSAGR